MKSETAIPYFKRPIINPPGRIEDYNLLNYQESLRAVTDSDLSVGAKNLLEGLLKRGGIAQFPGGVGINYDLVYKHRYDTKSAQKAMKEMAEKLEGQVDVILAPDSSAIAPATHLASLLGKDVIRILRNNKVPNDSYRAQIDSYTGGGRDTLFVSKEAIKAAVSDGKLRVFIMDDIVDTGAMVESIIALVSQMKKDGIDIEVIGFGALMEKTYGQASENIKKKYGLQSLCVLPIEDLGLEPNPWIKIQHVVGALSFANR